MLQNKFYEEINIENAGVMVKSTAINKENAGISVKTKFFCKFWHHGKSEARERRNPGRRKFMIKPSEDIKMFSNE